MLRATGQFWGTLGLEHVVTGHLIRNCEVEAAEHDRAQGLCMHHVTPCILYVRHGLCVFAKLECLTPLTLVYHCSKRLFMQQSIMVGIITIICVAVWFSLP